MLKRQCRGASLIETSLTAGIMVLIIGLIISVYSEGVFRRGLQAEAYEVSVLARAAKSHVLTDLQGWQRATLAAPGRLLSIPIDTLVMRGHYPSTAPRITSRKRTLSVFLWAETDADNSPVLVMAQAQFPTGRSGRVGVPRGHALVTSAGWAAPHAPAEIQGPGLLFEKVAILQNAGRRISPGDLFAFEYISAGRDASPYLHRSEQVGRPALNLMETDLDLNNNSIVGVNNISAESIDIEADLTTHTLTGDVTFKGPMTVEADMSITGNATIGGNIDVVGTTTTEELRVTGTIRAQTIDVLGTATFENLAAENLTATALKTGQFTVELFNADAVTGTTADVEILTAAQMIIEGRVTSEEIFTRTLRTGSCVGC